MKEDKNTEAVGAVILYHDYLRLKAWVLEALEEDTIEPHGSGYSQEFRLLSVCSDLHLAFYLVSGYTSTAENRAFEHMEFVLYEFLDVLEDYAPDSVYLAFAHVGDESVNDGEYIGFSSLTQGLHHFNIDLNTLAKLRLKAQTEGEKIWTIAS